MLPFPLPQQLVTSGLPASLGYSRRCHAAGAALCVTSASFPSAMLLPKASCVLWAGPLAGPRPAAVRGTVYVNGRRRLARAHPQTAGWGVARTRPGLGLWPP